MGKLAKIACAIMATFSVGACSSYSEQDLAAIDQVVSALPTEVEGCTFLGDIDSNYGSFSINGARNILKLKTAQLGGNHLVETNLAVRADYMLPPPHWDTPFIGHDEFYMTGRAYYCPVGKGVKVAPKSKLSDERQGFANKPYTDEKHQPLSADKLDNNAAPNHSVHINEQVNLPKEPLKEAFKEPQKEPMLGQ